jgi:transcriptional regulator with XRE-family HTH domain
MAPEQHWTEDSSDAFAHRLAFDFIAQIEKRMEALPISQIELARKLKITEGAVSKFLNNPQNLTLRTIAKYSRALGIKAAIVAYDDGDVENSHGPIASEMFTACWERVGRPHDLWALAAKEMHQHASTVDCFVWGASSEATTPNITGFGPFALDLSRLDYQRTCCASSTITTASMQDIFHCQQSKREGTNSMPEIKNYTFEHTELAAILVRKLDIHEGFWGVFIEFAFSAANLPAGPDGKTFLPASINFVKKIGIQRFEEPTNLTVDAAELNPIVKRKR